MGTWCKLVSNISKFLQKANISHINIFLIQQCQLFVPTFFKSLPNQRLDLEQAGHVYIRVSLSFHCKKRDEFCAYRFHFTNKPGKLTCHHPDYIVFAKDICDLHTCKSVLQKLPTLRLAIANLYVVMQRL